jgi:hypothetical protein
MTWPAWRCFMRSVLTRGLIWLFCAGLPQVALPASDELAREYRIKAAYLYNLSKFITWPDEGAQDKSAPVMICVYGYNPFGQYLEKLQERTVKGRPIAIRYVNDHQPISGCQILFISQHNTTTPKALTMSPSSSPVLTVSDDEDFLNHGGLVALVTVNNNVQLDINLSRAKQAGFIISANLLEVARKIE